MIPVYPYSILQLKNKIPRDSIRPRSQQPCIMWNPFCKLQCCAMKGEESQSSWKGVKGTGCKLNWWRCLVALISWMLWILLHSWPKWPLPRWMHRSNRNVWRFRVPKLVGGHSHNSCQFIASSAELTANGYIKGIPLNGTLILVQKPR